VSATQARISNTPTTDIPEEVITAIAHLVRDVRFGSIEIIVHEGRITQIERREKVRFAGPGAHRIG
jgi:hypothetical protein